MRGYFSHSLGVTGLDLPSISTRDGECVIWFLGVVILLLLADLELLLLDLLDYLDLLNVPLWLDVGVWILLSRYVV